MLNVGSNITAKLSKKGKVVLNCAYLKIGNLVKFRFSDSYKGTLLKADTSIDDILRPNQYRQGMGSNGEYDSSQRQMKRTRCSFLRDGMFLSLYLKKDGTGRNDGYVFLELKEFTEDFQRNQNETRFILLKQIQISKILLLSPRCHVENPDKLERIEIKSKSRNLEIEQNLENKYVVTLKVLPKDNTAFDDINEFAPPRQTNTIISQIELNPEDILLLNKFLNKCLDELLNL